MSVGVVTVIGASLFFPVLLGYVIWRGLAEMEREYRRMHGYDDGKGADN